MNVPALLATYQLRQREYLLRITRAMTSRLDLPSLLKLILSSAADLVGCRAGLIVLVRDESAPAEVGAADQAEYEIEPFLYEIRAFYNIAPEILPAFRPLLDIIPAVPINAAQDDAQTFQAELQQRVRQIEEQLDMVFGQVVGLPLLFENDLLGFIYLFRGEHAFTELDSEFLVGFAYQAAIAVRNARLYHQLETEKSRLATLIEKSTSGIMILDASRRVALINQPLAVMLDIEPQDAIGQPGGSVLALDNVRGDDLLEFEDYLDTLTEGGLACEGEINRPDHKQIVVSVTYTPLFDEDKRLVNIIATIHDITRFRAEEEIKNTFTSIISHELKTPVALIKGYAQTLARPDAEWDINTARQGLAIIEEEADRLEALIDNLLDVSRIQASGIMLDYSYVDLGKLAHRVAEAYQMQTDDHQIEVDVPEDLPAIWGDGERLRQVLTNLMGNAIKYSPDGGLIRIGIWTDTAPDSGEPRLVVYLADQGIGIPEDELPHIFDRFYRVDSSLRRRTAGAGLGLFLCKAIIEAHGGQIWVRTDRSKGTTFFFSLPLQMDQENNDTIRVIGPDTSAWQILNQS